MIDRLKEFDDAKIMIRRVPGCFVIPFRSFARRGRFPAIKKDDLAAFLLGSTLYDVPLSSAISGHGLAPVGWTPGWSCSFGPLLLAGLPILPGLALGLFEAGDGTGRTVRRAVLSVPAPSLTAGRDTRRPRACGESRGRRPQEVFPSGPTLLYTGF